MRYLCLIYGDENAVLSEKETNEMYPAYEAFGKAATDAGVIRGGDALQPTTVATTVRVRNDETMTTDGPFAETKEQLGGYYELECKDLDEAILWAAKIPGASHGCVEVRPIMEFD
jgi:hypothetical protein